MNFANFKNYAMAQAVINSAKNDILTRIRNRQDIAQSLAGKIYGSGTRLSSEMLPKNLQWLAYSVELVDVHDAHTSNPIVEISYTSKRDSGSKVVKVRLDSKFFTQSDRDFSTSLRHSLREIKNLNIIRESRTQIERTQKAIDELTSQLPVYERNLKKANADLNKIAGKCEARAVEIGKKRHAKLNLEG